jgi:hypothetical protein
MGDNFYRIRDENERIAGSDLLLSVSSGKNGSRSSIFFRDSRLNAAVNALPTDEKARQVRSYAMFLSSLRQFLTTHPIQGMDFADFAQIISRCIDK